EHAAEEHRLKEVRAKAEELFAEAQDEWDRAQKERNRCSVLLKRLKRRWEERFAVHEATLRQREQDLDRQRLGVEESATGVEQDRAGVADARRRFNGEVEVERRELERAWNELSGERAQWAAALEQERAAGDFLFQQAAQRETTSLQAEQQLA